MCSEFNDIRGEQFTHLDSHLFLIHSSLVLQLLYDYGSMCLENPSAPVGRDIIPAISPSHCIPGIRTIDLNFATGRATSPIKGSLRVQ